MSFARRSIALVVTVAALLAVVAAGAPSALAQDPPNQGQGQGKGKAGAIKKKPARRRPRSNAAVGVIVPYPFPPSLIIRHTPETHDEIRALLNMLRYN
jgi:hypothetical protein